MAVSLAIMAVVLAVTLFTPRIHPGDCLDVVDLEAGMTVPLNCDSRVVAKQARFLVEYLTQENAWRTRPVHMFATAAITEVAAPGILPLAAAIAKRLPPRQKGIRGLLPFYLGAIVINVLILVATFVLFVLLLDARSPMVIYGLAAIVASFDITVGWFWVPHTIFFNLIVPPSVVMAFLLGMLIRRYQTVEIALLGLLVAAACLSYGFFLIWPVAFVLGALGGWLRWPEGLSPGRLLARLAVFSLAVIAPLVIWFGLYYLADLEIAYEAQRAGGQFLWIAEAIRDGRFGEAFSAKYTLFILALTRHLGIYGLGLFALAAGLAGWRVWLVGWRAVFGDPFLIASLVATGLMLGFNLLQGYYPPRLHVPLILIAILIFLWLLRLSPLSRLMAPATWSIAVVQIVLALARSPVSWD